MGKGQGQMSAWIETFRRNGFTPRLFLFTMLLYVVALLIAFSTDRPVVTLYMLAFPIATASCLQALRNGKRRAAQDGSDAPSEDARPAHARQRSR